MHKIKFAFVYRVDPTSPNLQSQQPHFKQSSCQNMSSALSKYRSVIGLQQPAHSWGLPLLVDFVASVFDTSMVIMGPLGRPFIWKKKLLSTNKTVVEIKRFIKQSEERWRTTQKACWRTASQVAFVQQWDLCSNPCSVRLLK